MRKDFNKKGENRTKKSKSYRKTEPLNRRTDESSKFRKARPDKKKYISKKHKKAKAESDEDAPVRLNKFLADAGICSRREADTYIQAGVVQVNGKSVTQLGTKVYKTDSVKFNGRTLRSEKLVYVIMNKPKDTITTSKDPQGRMTVMDVIGKHVKERVQPVGRLDRNTTGVLLLTNDGKLARKLTHPSYNKKKIYHVFLDKPVTKEHMKQLIEGVRLEDGISSFDAAKYPDVSKKQEVGVELHSGKNRIVRRTFEALGYKVKKLDRVYFAGLTKKSIPRGRWRYLTEKEIAILKMGAYA